MAILEKDVNLYALEEVPTVEAEKMEADADMQDDALWDQTFAASQDTLSRIAARSRAHREAGRTKKISE